MKIIFKNSEIYNQLDTDWTLEEISIDWLREENIIIYNNFYAMCINYD